MCGIAGIVSPDPAVRDVARLRHMLGRLVHRGPDEEGVAEATGAAIGARRLSIIDLASGHQPMRNEDGTVLAVQNGEIYNFRELREGLLSAGHRFTTRNDTEVLPHAYEEWGDDFVRRLRGMFAIAIWDDRRGRLLLARDRLGKKPLVYIRRGRELFFASEIQSLLALSEVGRDIDDAAIREYLTYGYVPAPRTAFAAIRKLEPGHVLVFEDGAVTTGRYWNVRFAPKERMGLSEAAETLRAKLDDAVRMRLVSDVPLGVLLSGGLDSSSVAAFAARHSDGPIRTFSIGFSDADYDELRYARIVARHFGTQHQELVVEPSALEALPTLVRHFGEPFADSSAIPTYYVAQLARRQVTVALNGDGGDELFGGYTRYRAVALAGWIDRVPGLAGALHATTERAPRALAAHRGVARVRRLLGALASAPDERYFRWMSVFGGPRAAMLSPDGAIGAGAGRSLFVDAADAVGAADPVDRSMAADLLTYLPGDLLVKMDIATMANSLEARSPFLDQELVEFACALPSAYKVSPFSSKIVLRTAMRGILPETILRRGKMGFGVPVGPWLRGPLRDMLRELVLSDRALSRGYVRADAIRTLVDEHLAGSADHTPFVWALLMLELWFRYCVERA